MFIFLDTRCHHFTQPRAKVGGVNMIRGQHTECSAGLQINIFKIWNLLVFHHITNLVVHVADLVSSLPVNIHFTLYKYMMDHLWSEVKVRGMKTQRCRFKSNLEHRMSYFEKQKYLDELFMFLCISIFIKKIYQCLYIQNEMYCYHGYETYNNSAINKIITRDVPNK